MLGKLAYRNTKRNIKDYLIYLITVTASFSLIFAFNLVANSDEIVKLCSSMDAFKNSLFAVNILIIFVICFLINYTTNAYSARTAHPFQRNGAPFRFKLSKAQQVD